MVIKIQLLKDILLNIRAQCRTIVDSSEIVISQVDLIVSGQVLPYYDINIRIQDLVVFGNQFRRKQTVITNSFLTSLQVMQQLPCLGTSAFKEEKSQPGP